MQETVFLDSILTWVPPPTNKYISVCAFLCVYVCVLLDFRHTSTNGFSSDDFKPSG